MNKLTLGMALMLSLILPACGRTGDRAVVVKVNNTRITVAGLKTQTADLSPDALQMIATDAKALQSVLDDVIAYELVLQEARRQGIEDMDFRKRHEMKRREMERRLQEDAKNELVTTLLRKELGDKLNIAPPTNAEVRSFYDKNRDKMVTADGRRVSLQEASPMIMNRLASMKQRDIYMQYAGTLRDKARVSISEDALRTFAGSLAPEPPAPHQPNAAPSGQGASTN